MEDRMLKTLTLSAALALTAGATLAQETGLTGPVYEIAIQEVKNGDVADWAAARAPLLAGLAQTPGVEEDWTLKAFFLPFLNPARCRSMSA